MVSLNTAWEWLAEERAAEDESYREIAWIDPATDKDSSTSFDSTSSDRQQTWKNVPLYPIPAVYLPVHGVNHTLNNVEPRNIQMAMDLSNATEKRFCLALRADDTGRIARVGTLMKIVHAEPHYATDDGSIARILVTCQAVETVTIDSIDNGPEAESRISKLMRSPVYLKAAVKSRRSDNVSGDLDRVEETIDQLVNDYMFVRSMYVDGIGREEIPVFARENLGDDLPDEWTPDMFDTEESFWQAAYTWQMLCNTVREGRQVNLSADRNEIMIEAASRKGGPLKLPIHLEDLPPDIQRQIQQMELDRQREFALECRMDPVLDFLVLLQQERLVEKINVLSKMVARERKRLTKKALIESQPAAQSLDTKSTKPPQKGAWFGDDS